MVESLCSLCAVGRDGDELVAAELLGSTGQRNELGLGTSGQGDELRLTSDGLSSGQGDGSLGSRDDVVVRRLDG